MEVDQTFQMMGQVHLAQWGNPQSAAQLIGALAERRATILDRGAPNVSDVQNIAFKFCDWFGYKPQDWRAFMSILRPHLLTDANGPQRAVAIFTSDYLRLDLPLTVELFRDRLSFFMPGGDFHVINNNEIPDNWVVKARFEGKTFWPPLSPR